MGSTQSVNDVKSITKSMIEMRTDVIQEHTSSASSVNVFKTKGCTLKGSTIRQSAIVKVDWKSAQVALMSSDFQSGADKAVKQQATTLSQNLNLNPGSTKGKQVLRSLTELKTAIDTTITQRCSVRSRSLNYLECVSSKYEQVFISQEIMIDSVASCVSESSAVARAENRLKEVLGQEAVTESENGLASVLKYIALVIGMVALLVLTVMLAKRMMAK
jgi:hypothetical protein